MLSYMTHQDYVTHVASFFSLHGDEPSMLAHVAQVPDALLMLLPLSLDPVRERLLALYCPTNQGDPRDPGAMLRSWLLMTQQREHSPDTWVKRLRREPLLAALAGFAPDDVPGATTLRDFLARLADGPYATRRAQDTTRSEAVKGRHTRRLKDATEARRQEAGPNNTQSAALVDRLLEQAEQPRDPHALRTFLEDLLVDLGLRPSLEAGLMTGSSQVLNSDGTILATAASPEGETTCDCEPHDPACDHPRSYTSPTAQWCKDSHHREWRFGDRTLTITLHTEQHDFPLITIMGRGNESDFTLAPKALDDLLKLVKEFELSLCPVYFTGDGHHDCQAMYLYVEQKGLIPIIPLRDSSAIDKDVKNHPLPGKKTASPSVDPATNAEADAAHKTAESAPKTEASASAPTTADPAPKTEAPASAPKTVDPAPKTEASASAPTTADPAPKTGAKGTASSDTTSKPATTRTRKTTTRPQVEAYPNIVFEPDGTPLCPAGCRMRHHAYNAKKAAHSYNCPAMRPNHQGEWIFHPEDCPVKKNCHPGPKMGLGMYIKSEADLRLFPPVPRDSKRFKELYNERTSVERSNAVEDSYHLDRAHRNAVFGEIRLCFVNICKHARIRWIEATKRRKPHEIAETLRDWLLHGDLTVPAPV